MPLLQVRKSLCGSLISCHTAINQQVEPRLFVPRVHLGLAISHPEPRLPSGCLSGICGIFSFSLVTFLPPPLWSFSATCASHGQTTSECSQASAQQPLDVLFIQGTFEGVSSLLQGGLAFALCRWYEKRLAYTLYVYIFWFFPLYLIPMLRLTARVSTYWALQVGNTDRGGTSLLMVVFGIWLWITAMWPVGPARGVAWCLCSPLPTASSSQPGLIWEAFLPLTVTACPLATPPRLPWSLEASSHHKTSFSSTLLLLSLLTVALHHLSKDVFHRNVCLVILLSYVSHFPDFFYKLARKKYLIKYCCPITVL